MYRYALLHVGDPNTAEDLVQDTLVAALQAVARFDQQSSERTWLIAILRHKLIDDVRRRKRKTADLEAVDDVIAENFTDGGKWRKGPKSWGRDPQAAMDDSEFWSVLAFCLTLLPERAAFAFCQREIEDSPSAEICEVLDTTPTNLWTLLHRARTRLRRCLETNWFSTGA